MGNAKGPVKDQPQGQQSGEWMAEDSTTGDGHPPRTRGEMFQRNWQKHYSTLGGTYDDYAPAYDYGVGIGDRDDWRGKQWNDIESDVRSNWEKDRPNTWDKFKDAIRYAWHKVTGATNQTPTR